MIAVAVAVAVAVAKAVAGAVAGMACVWVCTTYCYCNSYSCSTACIIGRLSIEVFHTCPRYAYRAVANEQITADCVVSFILE